MTAVHPLTAHRYSRYLKGEKWKIQGVVVVVVVVFVYMYTQ